MLRYAVLYAAETSACAMVERIVLDRFAHRVSPRLHRTEIEQRSLVSLASRAPLRLLDLRDGGASRIGCPDPRTRARMLARRTELDAEAIWQWGAIERVSSGLVATRIGLQSIGRQCCAGRPPARANRPHGR